MKKTIWYYILGVSALTFAACDDEWNDHFDEAGSEATSGVEVYKGNAASFVQGESGLKQFASLYEQAGLMDVIGRDDSYCTLIVCEDANINPATDSEAMSNEKFVTNTVSDLSIAPVTLVDGFGIYTRCGKNIWVTLDADGNKLLNGKKITRMVQTDNGYVYFVDGIISAAPSLYEYIQSLGDDYSMFKSFVAEFEEQYFDADASTPNGVDVMGNTTYSDSVISTKNTLMDRYNENGLPTWDMRSESYLSTLFVPNNKLLEHAYTAALDSVKLFLRRSVTSADSLKFRKWIVESCFVDRKLSPEEVAPTASQFECVGGYVQEIDETSDTETYESIDAAQWNPAIQHVDYENPVNLSNGYAYLLTDYYKIPNHIVIWRVKARFYQIWSALNATQQGWDATNLVATGGGYFRWNHWIKPLVVNEAQGSFELSATLPTIYYHVLTAEPDQESQTDSLTVSVEYDGLLYNADEKQYGLQEVYLPAGEYNLRMGFKHSLDYSLSIYFCGADEEFSEANCLVKDMAMKATGSNFHFDRAGASEGLELYGDDASGYPEYFDWRWWYDQDPSLYQKASAYDTDGYQVARVVLHKPGNFKIKIESSDNAIFYKNGAMNRSKSDVQQLMMYHWCLRPTTNNY